jgi:hypothetical protein
MEHFFQQAREQLSLRTEICQRAAAVLCEWLDRQVGHGHTESLLGISPSLKKAGGASRLRLLDRSLAVIEAPHGADVSLAMALRATGLSLDQADAFVELFLAHLQRLCVPDWAGSERQLLRWLGQSVEGECHVVPS